MRVKIVSLEQCGATQQTITLVHEVARDLGIAIEFEHVLISTPEEARMHRHIGSPTVQIAGMDIDPGARDVQQFGVS